MYPEWFILDLDPALNFPSSGSGSRSRQKFRIHADPDPTHVIEVYLEIVNKTNLNLNLKKNLYQLFAIFYFTGILQSYSTGTQSPEFKEK